MKQKLINKIEKKQNQSINMLIVNLLLLFIGLVLALYYKNAFLITDDMFLYIFCVLVVLVGISLVLTIRNYRLGIKYEKIIKTKQH